MNTQVPFVDLKSQYSSIRPEIARALEEILDSAHFIGGPELERFEHEFAAFCGASYAVGVANGTDAITLAMKVAGVGSRDEVLVPANSFFASAEAVSNAGAKPVFVDIDPQTFLMDPESAARAITPRTRAILPVHLYGRALDMRPFEELAAAHQLTIIEDCAQAHGAAVSGQTVGSSGRLTTYSFYPGKNLGAYGDGGAVTTSDPHLRSHLLQLRDHGSPRKYEHAHIGYNSRLDTLQAAVLSVKLRHLHTWNAARRKHAEFYAAALAGSPIVAPQIPAQGEHVFHLFVIRCSRRDELQKFLAERGISTGIHYPTPLHLTEAYQREGAPGRGAFPVSEAFAGEILSLPMFAELTSDQLNRTADAVLEFARTESLDAPCSLEELKAGG
jgi:dTDP-4-amino-4,6-dideoxygalactose transaminase